MTTIKLISAGLIAVAILTTSAAAHETSAAERYVARTHYTSSTPADHWLDSYARMLAPAAAKSDLSLQNQPGGVCDAGDNPRIC